MYHGTLTDYVPMPDPATSDRIVAAHYYAAWKKGAAEIHNGFDDLHGYPLRTPLCGYYDEESPEYADWEIKWALEHGINCFIHCWYRRPENQGKPVTVEALRCGHGLHEAFFHARYQSMINFAIMFECSPRWGATDSEDLIDHLMPFWTENYFKRGNYLLIDNKPVLFCYYPKRFLEIWPDPKDQQKAFDRCRDFAREQGFDGMLFALCDARPTEEANVESIQRGFDFRFAYTSGYKPLENEPPAEEVIQGQCDLLRIRLSVDPLRFIPTASCFWDPTPRFSQHWRDLGYKFHESKIWHLSPAEFRQVIKEMKRISDDLPEEAYGRRLMMLDNWNEWDEGHFIAPSLAFGYAYLQAIREELTQRDNLPDYRTPQELGIGHRLNHSWTEPDFSNEESFLSDPLRDSQK